MSKQVIEEAYYRGVKLRKYTSGNYHRCTAQFSDEEDELCGHLLILLNIIDRCLGVEGSLLKEEHREGR